MDTTFDRIALQKEGLIGKPYTRVWDSSRPSSNALFATSSEGQYNRFTDGWNLKKHPILVYQQLLTLPFNEMSDETSSLPCTVASAEVCNDSYKYDLLVQALPFEHPQRDMLHERMNAYDDVGFELH